jgi:hypothetical protein
MKPEGVAQVAKNIHSMQSEKDKEKLGEGK